MTENIKNEKDIVGPSCESGANEPSESAADEEQEEPCDNSEICPQMLPLRKYEYLDHPADVQIHAWGDTLQEAFEQCAMGMFGYMTDIETVDNLGTIEIEAEATDATSLLFKFLDEFLFTFCVEPYFISRVWNSKKRSIIKFN